MCYSPRRIWRGTPNWIPGITMQEGMPEKTFETSSTFRRSRRSRRFCQFRRLYRLPYRTDGRRHRRETVSAHDMSSRRVWRADRDLRTRLRISLETVLIMIGPPPIPMFLKDPNQKLPHHFQSISLGITRPLQSGDNALRYPDARHPLIHIARRPCPLKQESTQKHGHLQISFRCLQQELLALGGEEQRLCLKEPRAGANLDGGAPIFRGCGEPGSRAAGAAITARRPLQRHVLQRGTSIQGSHRRQ